MSSENVQQRTRGFVMNSELAKSITYSRIVHPKKNIPPELLMFYLYIQPLVVLLATVIIIVTSYFLRNNQFRKKYGLLIGYTSLELCSFFVHSAAIIGTIIGGKDYIQYEYCLLYRISVNVIPIVLYSVGNWLKVAHALQWALMVHVPMTFKKYFKVTYVVIVTLVLTCVFTGITTMTMVMLKTEVTYLLDTSSNSIEKACRFSVRNKKTLQEDVSIREILSLSLYIIGDAVPALALSVCSSALVMKIREQIRFRKLNAGSGGQNPGQSRDMDRIVVVVTINTMIFIVVTIPKFFTIVSINYADMITFDIDYYNTVMAERILRCISVVTTCLLFAYLSSEFRNAFTCRKADNSHNVQSQPAHPGK